MSNGTSATPTGLLPEAEPVPVSSDDDAAIPSAGIVYRSQEYAMCTIDTGRDADGAPLNEVWTFAGDDDYVEGYGHLIVMVKEIVETRLSGTLAVYYRHWIAPDGSPAWGLKPKRVVGSLSSLKALIRRRDMKASAIEAGTAETGTGSVHESAVPTGDAQ